MSDPRFSAAHATPSDLAFALCHEIGNLVGAVRLHAHLIDDEMSRRDLALSTVEIDDLCARSAALLAHLRPLLSDAVPPSSDGVVPAELLRSLQEMMVEHGGRGARLSFEAASDLPEIEVDREVLHHLLQSLLFAALESAGSNGSVSLRTEQETSGVAFVVEDDGRVDEDPAAWRDQVVRGRPLVCAVAHEIVSKRGGSLEVVRRANRTRVSLVLPVRKQPD